MKGKPISKATALKAKQLFKAHYTRKEAQKILGISYSAVVTLYRTYESLALQKYDKFSLIPADAITDLFLE